MAKQPSGEILGVAVTIPLHFTLLDFLCTVQTLEGFPPIQQSGSNPREYRNSSQEPVVANL